MDMRRFLDSAIPTLLTSLMTTIGKTAKYLSPFRGLCTKLEKLSYNINFIYTCVFEMTTGKCKEITSKCKEAAGKCEGTTVNVKRI
jgi:hypothetical protein